MHQYPFRKRFGFEEVVLSEGRCPSDDYDEFLNRNMAEGGAGYWGSGVMHNDWTARPFHLPEELHHTNWTINEAQRFLHRRDPSRPFFLVASFMAAHPPLVPPAYYFERYLRTGVPDPMIGDWAVPPDHGGLGQGVKGSDVDPLTGDGRNVDLTGERLLSARAGYYGLINHLDDQIRRLIHETQGCVDLGNTIILYTADHGEMLGDHHLWSKLVPYQPSIRIPLLVWAPDSFGFQKGSVQDQLVCLEDLMPTLLELADLPIPSTVEGKSLIPILKGENAAWREVLHIECAPIHHTLTDGKEKYIWFAADGKERYFNEARRWFRDAAANTDDASLSFRMARYGEALCLLNAIPKTSGNIKLADGIFAELAEGPEEDAVTRRALYHRGRIQQIHIRVPDWEKATALYREMIERWPGEVFTQFAIVKLATIQLYEPTSPAEKRRRYTELAALESQLGFAPARRDFHYVLGVACLSLELSKERALYHLMAYEEAGIAFPFIRINTYCRIGVTAKQLGRFELAAAYFRKFIAASPRDPRTQMIKDQIEDLPPHARALALGEG